MEEGVDGAAKPGKRAREDDEPKAKPGKNKKLKKDGGEAVPTGKDVVAEKKDKKEKEDKKDEKEKEDKKDKKGKEKSAQVDQEVKELPGGLKYQDATIGTGPRAKKGDKLQMRYIGKLTNGKVFDKNTKGKPVSGSSPFFRYNTLI